MSRHWVNYEHKGGDTISAHNLRIVPFARSLHLRFPGVQGGLIWNRPASILVISPDGQEQILPVPDVTRQIQFSLIGAGILGTLLIWVLFRFIPGRQKESKS